MFFGGRCSGATHSSCFPLQMTSLAYTYQVDRRYTHFFRQLYLQLKLPSHACMPVTVVVGQQLRQHKLSCTSSFVLARDVCCQGACTSYFGCQLAQTTAQITSTTCTFQSPEREKVLPKCCFSRLTSKVRLLCFKRFGFAQSAVQDFDSAQDDWSGAAVSVKMGMHFPDHYYGMVKRMVLYCELNVLLETRQNMSWWHIALSLSSGWH